MKERMAKERERERWFWEEILSSSFVSFMIIMVIKFHCRQFCCHFLSFLTFSLALCFILNVYNSPSPSHFSSFSFGHQEQQSVQNVLKFKSHTQFRRRIWNLNLVPCYYLVICSLCSSSPVLLLLSHISCIIFVPSSC